MKTLDLKQAAELLRIHPVTLLRKALSGEIPGAKPGKRWVFIDDDLVEYLRSKYVQQRNMQPTSEASEWHSISKRGPRIGGLMSPSMDDEYARALGLAKRDGRRSTTTA